MAAMTCTWTATPKVQHESLEGVGRVLPLPLLLVCVLYNVMHTFLNFVQFQVILRIFTVWLLHCIHLEYAVKPNLEQYSFQSLHSYLCKLHCVCDDSSNLQISLAEGDGGLLWKQKLVRPRDIQPQLT